MHSSAIKVRLSSQGKISFEWVLGRCQIGGDNGENGSSEGLRRARGDESVFWGYWEVRRAKRACIEFGGRECGAG